MAITKILTWRAKLLALLRAHKTALSAYNLLDEMHQLNPKNSPPTLYRPLATMAQQGWTHVLESVSAFVARQYDQYQKALKLPACQSRGLVEKRLVCLEPGAISDVTRQSGFAQTQQIKELLRCYAWGRGVLHL